MKGFVQNIESRAVKHDEFRQVLYTAKQRNRESITRTRHLR